MVVPATAITLDRPGLDALIRALATDGRRVLGPVVRDGAICYGDIASTRDLPEGWSDEQDAGRYRLRRRDDQALFAYAVGPHSWKQFLHPPRVSLWTAQRTGRSFEVTSAGPTPPERFAFLGVRACELHAIRLQDRVFLGDSGAAPGSIVNSAYRQLRDNAVIVAVNCGAPANTCFCTSMGAGPRATADFDLALTELPGERYLVEIGTDTGAAFLTQVAHRAATDQERTAAEDVTAAASEMMTRSMPVEGLKESLQSGADHPHWDDVAARCLACGNCTQVCPTCFCTTVEDVTDLAGARTERVRRWDSCFTAGFSYVHGGVVRDATAARYRQWLTHKLASWIDQFGSSGCVGCGRCIAWCPVGIDITAEARAIAHGPAETHD
jgi:ferredoxin